MLNFLIAAFLLFTGAGGGVIHFKASKLDGPFVGTKREFDFVVGALLAILCLPAGVTMIFA